MTKTINTKFYLRVCVIVVVVFVISTYVFFRTKDMARGATITILEPQTGAARSPALDVRGKITRSSAVFMNDRKIYLDETGNFKEVVVLSPGYNIITIRAEDRFGRRKEKKLELVYDPDQQ
ncbi:MAG: hypothetical protein A3G52_04305 [Candidatus Taylorbacteria bacterium RIFCSPLOWO2_12_FULL_43_20]|uniref:Uncharacterized protein n=1 Tax=Candidatus Taylorbacteria bacterium RIFCSPLOWO2_12_FULL_43_20 TaxID=1802332 RepID=A0A1G2P253_9BACT|nr:MAG: hypothetical protein A3H58_03485 [Candidatus Taylorbacteria bacterium RIFCSPLOWO2_02_FULL_43_22b]OHA41661.1 MAG: hypothetical protein A3G52_04305 [Candidatus Taylorbacteria bacterium RIFCSPLOWO2_12_FULL_43_20]